MTTKLPGNQTIQLESVAVKCPKSESWIVVSRVSFLKLTDLVNFPAKKLD